MIDRLEKWVLWATDSQLKEFLFVVALSSIAFGLAWCGHWVAGRVGLIVLSCIGVLPVLVSFAVLLRSKCREEENIRSGDEDSSQVITISRRFRRTFIDTFSNWSWSWLGLYILGTMYAFFSGQPKQGWDMVRPENLMWGVLAIGTLGAVFAFLMASIFCWFRDKDIDNNAD